MRFSKALSFVVLFGGEAVCGFPMAGNSEAVAQLSRDLESLARRTAEKWLLFDPMTTPIDVTGDHSFIPPDFKKGHQRGPCPGLNALANHGYIGRNGVTNIAEVTAAVNDVFGMGTDLGGALAVMATIFVGNPLSLSPGFSIGGQSTETWNLLGNLFGLLGKPRGLEGSHNIIESDSSNTRNDVYMTGDVSTLELNQFIDWYEMDSDPVGDFTVDMMAQRANERFQQTKATNPNFYYGPYTGTIARNAGYIFPARLFRNYSRENPAGVLTKETMKSFYGVEGGKGTFTYKKGWERIPENWYRIPNDYGLAQVNLDLIDWIMKYPELGSIGGNNGKVNTFTGLDVGDITGGVLNTATLLEGNNLMCFIFQIVKTASPNILSTLFEALETPLQLLAEALKVPLLSSSCPAMTELKVGGKGFEEGIKEMFPGAAMSGGAL